MKHHARRLAVARLLGPALLVVVGCGSGEEEGASAVDPGRVTLHRLNRTEYNNTVRDLLGTALSPADEFPVDDNAGGFDNIAEVLSLSPLQVEQYQRAAEVLVAELTRPASGELRQLDAQKLGCAPANVCNNAGAALRLYSNGETGGPVTLPGSGPYRVTLRAYGEQAGPDKVQMALKLDGATTRTFTVSATSPTVYEVEVQRDRGGVVQVAAAFTNDYYDQPNMMDRNLVVEWIRVEGPLDAAEVQRRKAAVFTCTPQRAEEEEPCAGRILAGFGRRAWRRPLAEAEVAGLLGLYRGARAEAGSAFEQAVSVALEGVLLAPQFLFRVELDEDPRSPAAHALAPHELAARLSYFLWSSTPDEALLQAAEGGRLQDPEGYRAEVRRLLADPRARALLQNFATQWLHLRYLAGHEVNTAVIPGFTPALRGAMLEESLLLLGDVLRGATRATDLVLGEYSYVNDLLARHYGVALPAGPDVGGGFRRWSLAGTPRVGMLTHASLLTVTSLPTRTSPVKRGAYLLDRLLCNPPPPPPPGVEGLTETMAPGRTVRQRLEEHRKNPACGGCHSIIDPVGFALESFDAIGAYRTMDAGAPVDASGVLPDGRSFTGARGFAELLREDERFGRCLSRNLLSYALGRGLQGDADEGRVAGLAAALREADQRVPALIEAVVHSDAFRLRRGEPEGVTP